MYYYTNDSISRTVAAAHNEKHAIGQLNSFKSFIILMRCTSATINPNQWEIIAL